MLAVVALGGGVDVSANGGTGATTTTGGFGGGGGAVPDAAVGGFAGDDGGVNIGGTGGAPTCRGVGVQGDVFDPNEVYMFGSVLPSLCGRHAVAHWSTPNYGLAGFECETAGASAQIRPSDGRLLLMRTYEDLREFRCDACPVGGYLEYPENPLANDPVIATPGCLPGTNSELFQFLVGPDGTVLHRCTGPDVTWRDSSGEIVFQDPTETLVHLGFNGWALTESSVVNLSTATSVPIVGLPSDRVLATRALAPDSFWIVTDPSPGWTDNDAYEDWPTELWRIDSSGLAALVGVYPPLPAKFWKPSSSQLDGCGALLEIRSGPDEILVDMIVRRELGGVSQTVYSESTNPLVKLHISQLLTGP